MNSGSKLKLKSTGRAIKTNSVRFKLNFRIFDKKPAMNFVKLTFKDIMKSQILFYDEKQENACREICNQLKIDNMPAIDGKNNFKLINGTFQKQLIEERNKVAVNQRVFEKGLLDQFEANDHNVLFVYEGNVMQGVIHICDYNADVVLQVIQEDILRFERNLRTLLILSEYENQDIIDYMGSKMKNSKFFREKYQSCVSRKSEMSQFGEFQLFDFSIMLYFCNSTYSEECFKTGRHGEKLRELRNLVMHGKNIVSQDRKSLIYSIQSLKDFFSDLNQLEHYSNLLIEKIRNKPGFIKTLKIDNSKKLEIIYRYRPEALEYFLGGRG